MTAWLPEPGPVRTLVAAVLGGALAGCGGTAPAHHSHPSAPAAAKHEAACKAALETMYTNLGGASFGTGRFLAGVNAEAQTGNLPAACRDIRGSQVMTIARNVSG